MQPLGGTHGSPGEVDLEDWADQARAEVAAQQRRREAWLRRQASEDASVVGVLIGHAEQGSTLAVTTRSGNRHVGQIQGAGSHLVTIEVTGARVAVALDSIDTISALAVDAREVAHPVGHRSGADPITMGDLLGLAAADRPDVVVVTWSGQQVGGELVSVGRDLAMVRPPDASPLVYVPLASVSEALLPPSTGSG